jgi:hypothetical protein
MIMYMCLFGAVTAGPLIGGAQASFHAWRPLFWIVAGIAAAGLATWLLTFQDAPPADRAAPRDPAALGLAAAGSVAAFWGASELTTHRFLDPVAVFPLLAGLALIIGLRVFQYRAPRRLLTLRRLVDLLRPAGWRGAGRRRALPARRGTAVGSQGGTVEGPRRFGLAGPRRC